MAGNRSSTSSPESTDLFYAGALERIRKYMLVISAIGLAVCLLRFRWPVAAGFLAGAAISYINHRWLERTVEAIGERITAGQSRERGGIIVARAVLRYVLVGAGAYAIFKVSLAGLYGFLGGLCLPVAAVVCEAAVELFVALRHGT